MDWPHGSGLLSRSSDLPREESRSRLATAAAPLAAPAFNQACEGVVAWRRVAIGYRHTKFSPIDVV